MKKHLKTLYAIALWLFVLTMGFFSGQGYQYQKDAKSFNEKDQLINSMLDPETFFANNSYQHLEGYRLDLPDEISTVSHFNDKNIDLMAVFIDDGGDIHLGFTGKTIPREQFLGEVDSLLLIEEHSELTSLVHK